MNVRAYAEKFIKDRRRRNQFVALVSAISLMVVLIVSRMNTLQAISMTDGSIRLSVSDTHTVLTGRDNRLYVNVEAKASRNSETTFLLRSDAAGADLSDLYTFTRAELTDADGFLVDEDGERTDSLLPGFVTTLIDDEGAEIELARSEADEYGVITYSFTLPADTETAFTLEFAEGAFEETVEERSFDITREIEVEVEEDDIAEEEEDTDEEDAEDAEESGESDEDADADTEEIELTDEEENIDITDDADEASDAVTVADEKEDVTTKVTDEVIVTEDETPAATEEKQEITIEDEAPALGSPVEVIGGDDEGVTLIDDQTRVVTSDIRLFAEETKTEIVEEILTLTEKNYTLAFAAQEYDVEYLMELEAESDEAKIVSSVILEADMTYATGEAPETEYEKIVLSWATRLATDNDTLLARSAFYRHTVNAGIYTDASYTEEIPDGSEITVDGVLPEDVIAMAYPEEIEFTDEETAAAYEIVCTYDITLFRLLSQVEAEEALAGDDEANTDATAVTDDGSVDKETVITFDGAEYVKYEPAEGNKVSVNIRTPEIIGDDANEYSVLRTEEAGTQTEMEVEPSASVAENATSVTFYTDHFTPYSVVRSRGDKNLIWFDPLNGVPNDNGSYSNTGGSSRDNATSSWWWALEQAKISMMNGNDVSIVFLNTYTITSDQDLPESMVGESGRPYTFKLVREYDNIGTNDVIEDESVAVNGFGGALLKIASGVNATMHNFDVNGAGVRAYAPLIEVEAGASLTLDNCYLHHGFNIMNGKSGEGNYVLCGRGGAVAVRGGNLTMNESGINNCRAVLGGGVYSEAGNGRNPVITLGGTAENPTVIENCHLHADPSAGDLSNERKYGGGVYVQSSYLTIGKNTLIRNNVATGGGGVFAASSDVTLDGGEVTGNKAYLHNSEVVYQHVPATGWTYDSPYHFMGSGGGIWIAGSIKKDGLKTDWVEDGSSACLPAMFTMKDGKINDNESGSWVNGQYKAGGTGGGLNLGHILRGEFTKNNDGSRVNFVINGGEIRNNSCPVAGGGIYFNGGEGRIEATNGNRIYISGNRTTGGNDMIEGKFSGGGIFNHSGSYIQIFDAVVTNNKVSGTDPFPELKQGGGIAACKTSSTKLNNDRGVAVYDNEVPASWYNKVGYNGDNYGNRRATGADIAFVSSEKSDQYITYAHDTYLNTRLLGGGEVGNNNWVFDVPGEADHGLPYDQDDLLSSTKYADGSNKDHCYNYEVLSGQKTDGIAILVKNALTTQQKTNAYAAAKVFIEDNTAFSRGGGIGNNGELEFGVSSASVSIVKSDEKTMERLAGAVFELSGTGQYAGYVQRKTTAADGRLVFRDIPDGVYELREIATPGEEYVLPMSAWIVTVVGGSVDITGPHIDGVVEEEMGSVIKYMVKTIHVTNSKETSFVKVVARKEWVDEDGNLITGDKLDRLPGIQVALYGGPSLAEQTLIKEVTLDHTNGWTYVWDKLSAYWGDEEDKIPAVYTVKELQTDYGIEFVSERLDKGEWVKADSLDPGNRYIFVTTGQGQSGQALMNGSDANGYRVILGTLNASQVEALDSIDPADVDPRYIWLVARTQSDTNRTDGMFMDGYRITSYADGRWLAYQRAGSNIDELLVTKTRTEIISSGVNEIIKYYKGNVTFANRTLAYKNSNLYAAMGDSGTQLQAYVWQGEGSGSSTTVTTTGEGWEFVPNNVIEDGETFAFTVPLTGESAIYGLSITEHNLYDAYPNVKGKLLIKRELFDRNADEAASARFMWTAESAGNNSFYLYQMYKGQKYYISEVDYSATFKFLTAEPFSSRALKIMFKNGMLYAGDGTYHMMVKTDRNHPEDIDELMLITESADYDRSCYASFRPLTYKWTEISETSYFSSYGYTAVNKETARYVLPSTGGMGTHWIYIAGIALLGGVVILSTRRRYD